MADNTIAVPYNGGLLATTTMHTRHSCELSAGKFLHVAYQTSPNYVFAYVSNTTNLKSGTFSDVNGPMRVILTSSTTVPSPSTATQALRVWKLSNTRALLLSNRSLAVLEIGANDDITVKAGNILAHMSATVPSYLTGSNPTNGYAYTGASGASVIGTYLQAWYVRDNVVYMVNRNPATGGAQYGTLQKIVYNPTADTLTATNIASPVSQQGGNNGANFARYYLQSIPGSTKKLFSLRTSAAATSAMLEAKISFAALIDSVDDSVTNLTSFSTGVVSLPVSTLVPLSETTILGLTTDGRGYYTWNGTSWNGTPAVFSTAGVNPVQSEALDANYFISFGLIGGGDLTLPSNSITVRIVKFVDASFAQVSTGTASGNGIVINTPPLIAAEQDLAYRSGTDAFIITGYTNNSLTPQIKVVTQPGA